MSDIRTTTEEFSVSGSLSNVKDQVESSEPVFELQETVQFLVKKIDELVKEVNTLKNQ
jgi:archaellum component FlaC